MAIAPGRKKHVLKLYENLTEDLIKLRAKIDELQNAGGDREETRQEADADLEDAHLTMVSRWNDCLRLME